MLRRRPRRTAPTWLRHPATGWLLLAALYVVATVLNVLLAFSMAVLWPVLLAVLLAMLAGACVAAAAAALRGTS